VLSPSLGICEHNLTGLILRSSAGRDASLLAGTIRYVLSANLQRKLPKVVFLRFYLISYMRRNVC